MAIGNHKTGGNQSAEERSEESVRQVETGRAAAMAYLKFLRNNDRCGMLDQIAFDMFGEPRSTSVRVQAAAFFSKLEEILRRTAPLLKIRRADDHDQICGEFVRAFNLTGPRRVAYLKELPQTLPQTLIEEKDAAAKKGASPRIDR
jgi:hypothetical protein